MGVVLGVVFCSTSFLLTKLNSDMGTNIMPCFQGFTGINENNYEQIGNKNASKIFQVGARVIHDSELFWHVEYSADGAHKYHVETWQAKGDSGKAENDRKQYRSVNKKIEIK